MTNDLIRSLGMTDFWKHEGQRSKDIDLVTNFCLINRQLLRVLHLLI